MTSSEPISPTASQPVPKQKKRRFWLKVGLPVVVVLILGAALWTWGTLGFVYSSAQRTGYVRNLSQEGWLCKTWEGELAVSNTPGVAATGTTFHFTIRSDSVAKALQLATGQQVTLSYDEHRGVPSTCFGETEDFVRGFRVNR